MRHAECGVRRSGAVSAFVGLPPSLGYGVAGRRDRSFWRDQPVRPVCGCAHPRFSAPPAKAPGGSGSNGQSAFASDGRFLSYKHGGGVSDVSIQRRQFQAMPGGQVCKIVVSDFIRFLGL